MDQVNQNHQGRYTCTPYNAQGTQGSSGQMEVLVRKPPTFTVEPESMYQRKISESVEMHCYAQEAEGTQKPKIQWHRVRMRCRRRSSSTCSHDCFAIRISRADLTVLVTLLMKRSNNRTVRLSTETKPIKNRVSNYFGTTLP